MENKHVIGLQKKEEGILMGKYSKKVMSQRKVLTTVSIVLSVILVLLIILLVGLNREQTPEVSVPDTTEATVETPTEEATEEITQEVSKTKELVVESVTEQEETVIVDTTYVTVKYPYAFSDLMSVEAETFEDHAALEFGAVIAETTYKAYTLYFDGEEGMPVGTLQLDGETYVVTAQFHEVSGVGKDDMTTFYAAQETFNDVVNSLSENEGFTAAD